MKDIRMDRKGFTLVEVLIVVAISAALSTLAIIYSRSGENQVALSIEESKIAQLILEAKELSIATYSQSGITCAYGVRFDYATSSYSLFEYDAATPVGPSNREICPSLASTTQQIKTDKIKEYRSGSWNIPTAKGVVLDGSGAPGNAVQLVLFYPPDPCMFVSFDGTTSKSACVGAATPPAESYVTLKTADGGTTRTIMVNPVGQVSL